MKLPVAKPLTFDEYMLSTMANDNASPQSNVYADNQANCAPAFTDDVKEAFEELGTSLQHIKDTLRRDDSNDSASTNKYSEILHTEPGSQVQCHYPQKMQKTPNNVESRVSDNSRFILPAQTTNRVPILNFKPCVPRIINYAGSASSSERPNSINSIVQKRDIDDSAITPLQYTKETDGEIDKVQCGIAGISSYIQTNERNDSEIVKPFEDVNCNYNTNASDRVAEEKSNDSDCARNCETMDCSLSTMISNTSCATTSEYVPNDEPDAQRETTTIDNLTDTINRVAAGEGVLRQCVTPKSKRNRIPLRKQDIQQLSQRKLETANSNQSCEHVNKLRKLQHESSELGTDESNDFRNVREYIPEGLFMHHSFIMANSECDDAQNSGIYKIKKPEEIDIATSSKICQGYEHGKIKDHYLLSKPNEDSFSKINYEKEINLDADIKIDHYLLNTPPRTFQRGNMATQGCENAPPTEPGNEKSDHLTTDVVTNEQELRQKASEHRDFSKKKESPSRAPELLAMHEELKSKTYLSKMPTLSLIRLEGLSPDKTVTIRTQKLKAPSQYCDIKGKTTGNKKPESTLVEHIYVNDQSTLKHQNADSEFDPAKLSFKNFTRSSVIPNETGQLTKSSKSGTEYHHKQSLFRLALGNNKTDLYVVPKLNRTEPGNNSTDTDKSSCSNIHRTGLAHVSGELDLSDQECSQHTAPLSPKALSTDAFDVLVPTNMTPSTLQVPSETVIDQCVSVSQETPSSTCVEYTDNTSSHFDVPIYGSNFSSKLTVAELLRVKRLKSSKAKEIHVNNPLKLYGKIVNKELSDTKTKNATDNTIVGKSKPKCIGMKVALEGKVRECKSVHNPERKECTGMRIDRHIIKHSLQGSICTQVVKPNKNVSRCSIKPNDTFTGEQLLCYLPKHIKPTNDDNDQCMPGSMNKNENTSMLLSKTFSIKVGNQIYIVKPAKVNIESEETAKAQSRKLTLPAPKQKSNINRKRRLPSEDAEHAKCIKNKIKRIIKNKNGPKERLAYSLDLMPSGSNAKQLQKANNYTVCSSTQTNVNDPYIVSGRSLSSEKYILPANFGGCYVRENHIKERESENKLMITMVISKSFEGKYMYSIQRTKLNFVSRNSTEFHRWFEYSNYPCRLNFKKKGKHLEQIDIETIKQGLYLIIHANKSLIDVSTHETTDMLAVLALYPPHISCIPNGTDAIVVGHITDTNGGSDYPDTSTIDDVEKLLNVVLGPKVLQNVDVFSDERYHSVTDANMSPKFHSSMFYTHDMHAYFTDGQAAKDSSSFTNVRIDKKGTHRTASVESGSREKLASCTSYSEKAMALKIKQQKLIESCQRLKQVKQ